MVWVEASHANTHAWAIAFFSYFWFKYNILSLHCCKLGSVVVIVCSAVNPLHPGSIRSWVVHVWCRNLEGDAQSYIFLLQSLALQLGLGQQCQPEGIAITWQQLFCLWKQRTVMLECGSLCKFCTTSSSSWYGMEWKMEWKFRYGI